MAAIKDQAIVLRRLDYSETSQVLLFLTREHGPQRLIAKGIKRGTKKVFATGIDLLERGDLVFVTSRRGSGSLGTLTEWRQREAYMGLRNGLPRLYGAQYAAEITAAMTEEADPHPELFDALASLFGVLAGGGDPLPRVVGYQRRLLDSAGLWPDLSRCVMCDKPAPLGRGAYFSAHQGGLVCRACAAPLPEKRKVLARTLTALREFPDADRGPSGFPVDAARDAFDLLNYTISHAIGKAPSLARFVTREE